MKTSEPLAPPRPNANTYWVVPGRLLAGEYPSAEEELAAIQRLIPFLEAGVTDFVDLTTADELAPYDALLQILAVKRGQTPTHQRFPIADYSVPEPAARMGAILDTLDGILAAGRVAYVHCWGGVGRTGTVVGCYLVRHGLEGAAALDRVARLYAQMSATKRLRHPDSPENDAQREFVRNWRAVERQS